MLPNFCIYNIWKQKLSVVYTDTQNHIKQKLLKCIISLLQVTVVLGAQWGDEGKGKVVDMLATKMDVVCRCQVRKNIHLLLSVTSWKSFIT